MPNEKTDEQIFQETFDLAAVGETSPEVAPAVAPVTPAEEVKEDVTPIAKVSPEETPSPPPVNYEEEYKKVLLDRERLETEKTQLSTDLEEARNVVAPAKPDVVPPTPPADIDVGSFLKSFLDSLSDEERAKISEYDTEFDTISEAEGLKRNVFFKALIRKLDDFKNEIKSDMENKLAPANAFIVEAAERNEIHEKEEHFNKIKAIHPDLKQHADDGSLLAWIEEQPLHQRRGLKEIYYQGSPEEVISMVTDFKKDKNIPTEPLHENTDNVIDIKKAERKKALTVPITKRGAVSVSAVDMNDFDSGYDEAIRKSGG